jgi:REP element-mobilizing transposase RayT
MPKRISQLSFNLDGLQKPKDIFGGSLLKNSHAKTKRPLHSKLPIHLVLRSTISAMRLPKTYKRVNETVSRVCRKHGVRIYNYSNVGNHLHLLIKLPNVWQWAAFIRELTGRISQVAQGLAGSDSGVGNFWKQRPFTRIVRGWQRAFRIVKEYINLNQLEAEGYISRRETKTLKDLRAIFSDW